MAIYTPPVHDTPATREELRMFEHRVQDTNSRRYRNRSLWMLGIGVLVTLFTYQYFHHGLWGKLNNYNKLPRLVLNGTTVTGNDLNLELYRPDGPDTYGSFVERVSVAIPGSNTASETWTPEMLSQVAIADIHNAYPYQHVKTGPWGLVVPLASKASVQLPLSSDTLTVLQQAGKVQVTVEDVSGVKWTYVFALK